MGTDNVTKLLGVLGRGKAFSQIHTELAACYEALRCATVTLGQVESTGKLADFGPALRVAERCTVQLDRLVDQLDAWHVVYDSELRESA